jgi:predicted transposase/invertase (TIGR01784 family)
MTEETEHHDKTVFWDRMRKYFIILENFDFQKIERPTLKDCWIEIIKNLGSDMYRIDPSVYECADSALLELIEKAKVSALTDDELVRYEAGLKALEDAVDFDELLSDSVREAKVESFAEGLAEGVAVGRIEGHAEGRAEGVAVGRIEGLAEGRAEGIAAGRIEGHAEGVAEGRTEGKNQAQIEIAKRMLSMKMDVDTIAQISGLSVEEVGKLG